MTFKDMRVGRCDNCGERKYVFRAPGGMGMLICQDCYEDNDTPSEEVDEVDESLFDSVDLNGVEDVDG